MLNRDSGSHIILHQTHTLHSARKLDARQPQQHSGLKTLVWCQGLERLQHRYVWSYATLCCSCALGMITPKPCDLQEKGGDKEGSAAQPRLETRDAQQRVGLGMHAAPNSAHVLCLCPTARQLQHTGVENNPRRTAHLRRYRTFIKPSALSV
jgi:hypothetical protein